MPQASPMMWSFLSTIPVIIMSSMMANNKALKTFLMGKKVKNLNLNKWVW